MTLPNLRSVACLSLLPALWSALVACDAVPGGGPGVNDDLTVDSFRTSTNSRGSFSVDFDVPENADHFQITAIGDRDEYVYVEELWDPSGERVVFWRDWWDNPRSLNNAIFGDRVAAFDWPSRNVDGKLTAGTWTLVGSMTDADYYYATSSGLEVSTAYKVDGNFDDGTVAVRIVWADGVDADPAVVAAVEDAVERWREVWTGAGITLRERYVSSTLDPELRFAWNGDDPDVERQSQSKDEDELQLIVGDQVGRTLGTYGVAGGIPGTIMPSGSTYVVLSWLAHAGRNAEFDADEIRLMGETMAHEVGHYTGLFHPVESGYDNWDALADTPECSGWRTCEDLLGTNVMYPYSICGGGTCLATDQLTDDQSGVMNRYVGAL
jgi:hypothetical protein